MIARRFAFGVALGLAWATAPLEASSQPLVVSGSPDIHVDQSGTLLRPADVAEDIEVLMPARVDLGPLPDGADVRALVVIGPNAVFTLGHTLTLAGGLVVRPRDLVFWDGSSYNLALDGGGSGFPDGAVIDAITVDPQTSELWISFDTHIDLFGTYVRDADVWNASTGSLAFDATVAGISEGMDVDAVSVLAGTDHILLSFDVGGTLGGVSFSDEDVLRYDPGANSWTLAVDVSASQPNWAAADLDAIHALPEPGPASLLGGLIGIGFLDARRKRKR